MGAPRDCFLIWETDIGQPPRRGGGSWMMRLCGGGRTRRLARQDPENQGSKTRIDDQGQGSRIKDKDQGQASRMKAGGRSWRPARQDPEDQGSRIKDHGPCFGTNEHPRRDTDVILR